MISLNSNFNAIAEQLTKTNNRKFFIFLDYDGTLSPIVKNIKTASIPTKTSRIIEELSKHSNVILSIISGRKLEELFEFLPLNKIIFAGNHGFKIAKKRKFPPDFCVGEEFKEGIKKIHKKAIEKLSVKRFNGVFIEFKEISVAFHYRCCENDVLSDLEEVLDGIVKEIGEEMFSKKKGKMVVEIVPKIDWNKGYAVDWIVKDFVSDKKEQIEPIIIYIGDDETDEEAMEFLKYKKPLTKNVCIRVLDREKRYNEIKTNADYFLSGTENVYQFLLEFNAFLTDF